MKDVWAVADIELDPGETFRDDYRDIPKLILVGDIFRIIPHGMSAWDTDDGWHTVDSLLSRIPDDSVFMMGNHEGRLSWLRKLVGCFTDQIFYEYECLLDKQVWRFKHGHQFSEWGILSYLADDLVALLTSNDLTRQAWYNFCRDRGWLGLGGVGVNAEKYEPIIAGIWGFALKEAHRDKVNLCIGHTHTACRIYTPWRQVINLAPCSPKLMGREE